MPTCCPSLDVKQSCRRHMACWYRFCLEALWRCADTAGGQSCADKPRNRSVRQVFRFHVSPQAVVWSRIAGWMQTSCFSAVPADLLLVSAPRKIPHPNCRPAKLRHSLCKTPKRSCGPISLRDFEKIQQGLTADALQLIKKSPLPSTRSSASRQGSPVSAVEALTASSRILSLNDSALMSHIPHNHSVRAAARRSTNAVRLASRVAIVRVARSMSSMEAVMLLAHFLDQ